MRTYNSSWGYGGSLQFLLGGTELTVLIHAPWGGGGTGYGELSVHPLPPGGMGGAYSAHPCPLGVRGELNVHPLPPGGMGGAYSAHPCLLGVWGIRCSPMPPSWRRAPTLLLIVL